MIIRRIGQRQKTPQVPPGAFSLAPDLYPRRRAVVEQAITWAGTPYLHMGRVKGVGCDCLTMLVEVYEAAGIVPHIEISFYPPDWNLHRDAERYLEGVMRYAREFKWQPGPFVGAPLEDETGMRLKTWPQPGDIAVWKFGRCYAHGAIVTQWPLIIPAWIGVGIIYGSAEQPVFEKRPVRFFDPFK
jgi:cell wall-associated NlpC family hydrolase